MIKQLDQPTWVDQNMEATQKFGDRIKMRYQHDIRADEGFVGP